MTPPHRKVRLSLIHRLVQHATMVACPIRLQERCEIFITCVSANGSRPEHGPESVICCDGSHPAPWLFYHEARATSGCAWHGRDVFTVLPTGFGKSLCYACPPTVFDLVLPVEGTSIVLAVTPLTAIMKDLVNVANRRAYLRPQARHNVAQ